MKTTTASSEQLHQQLSYPWVTPPAAGDWQSIAEGVVWLRMPLPFGLDHINLYLLRHEDGWIIVDTGLGTERSREVWEKVFSELLLDAPVKAVIATHFHHDHAGCLGWLSRRFKCPVYMTRGEYQALFIGPPKGGEMGWEISRFYHRCGVSEARLKEFYKIIGGGDFEQDVPASFTRLVDGQVLRIGGRDWEIVIGSGHSPEHACLYCRQDKLFISGDQVLPKITSNVGVTVTEPDANPLADWLSSLQRLRAVSDDVLVLPAHERPFHGLHHRLAQLAEHHHEHLDAMTAELIEEKTADEMMAFMFPRAKSAFDTLLANGETLAHLNFLLNEGRITRRLSDERYRYRRVGGSHAVAADALAIHI